MKLFEGIKGTKEMTTEELHGLVAMLRTMRASSLTQASRAVKTRSARVTKPTRKTVSVDDILATLTPEQAAELQQMLAGKTRG